MARLPGATVRADVGARERTIPIWCVVWAGEESVWPWACCGGIVLADRRAGAGDVSVGTPAGCRAAASIDLNKCAWELVSST